jgi:hypothetical protein
MYVAQHVAKQEGLVEQGGFRLVGKAHGLLRQAQRLLSQAQHFLTERNRGEGSRGREGAGDVATGGRCFTRLKHFSSNLHASSHLLS